jgi:RNA polymerase sigma-70 factor, ECF subfamily
VALDVEGHYLRYGPMVLRRCRALLRDPAKAEDAMQDVFVTLMRFEDRLSDEAPGALLLRVATNLCLNRMRGDRRRREDTGVETDDLPARIAQADEPGGGAESQTAARSIIAKLFRSDDPLAASTRSLAFMHLVDGMTLAEVARESRLSVSGVRKRLRGLRGRLVELEGV